jgi:SAM-dependent methyltransferase
MRRLISRCIAYLPPPVANAVRRLGHACLRRFGTADSYASRLASENARFSSDLDVHALPEISHYWSHKHLLPMEREFGFSHPEEFLANYLQEAARRTGSRPLRFVSLGAGNCDAEVRIAQTLIERGIAEFTLECVEINPAMRERGAQMAADAGLADTVIPVHGDFNRWRPTHRYDAVMANQSLHHVLELEDLFDQVRAALLPRGLFLASDMIGRNGHQRWPEALRIVHEFWDELPDAYRYNLQLRRQQKRFMDWDCSYAGFEGIRAQDVLPLLVERFDFEMFLAFGNLIDPFIDRGIGHHFNPEREWDRDFIDRIHARDEAELQAGRIKPTHMMAAMGTDLPEPCRHRLNLSPQFCIRHVSAGRGLWRWLGFNRPRRGRATH